MSSQPTNTPLTWESVLRAVEEEIAANAPDPEPEPEKEAEPKEPRTLSEKIKADPELCAVLERRPELCAQFERAAVRLDTLNHSVDEYLSASPLGFEKMLWALLQLEIEMDGAGNPVITPAGQFSFPLMDAKQRTVFERFLSWQRRWYLWPQIEHQIKTSSSWKEENKLCALEAITQARILLGEAFPASGGVC